MNTSTQYVAAVKIQNKDQGRDLLKYWSQFGYKWRGWNELTENRITDILRWDLGNKSTLLLSPDGFVDYCGETDWRGFYRDRTRADFKGTYLQYMKSLGAVNVELEVGDYL